jgi:hypothetical protein
MWRRGHSIGMVRTAIAVAVVLLLATGRVSWAGEREDWARAESYAATTEYNLGHLDAALLHYEEAYRLVPDAIFLYNIGQCHRLSGRRPEAVTAYRAYLGKAAPDSPRRAQVERWIEELDPDAGKPVAPRPSPPPAGSVLTLPLRAGPDSDIVVNTPAAPPPPPLHRRPWLWVAVGAAALAVVVTVVALSAGRTDIPGSALGNQDLYR